MIIQLLLLVVGIGALFVWYGLTHGWAAAFGMLAAVCLILFFLFSA